ncbi:MAG: methyltransferase domain-containing protein [Woeseiaceae bacterium]|nr:methyltransferase domain-containing protein [Woeseiaceae bacterium]
MRVRTSTNRPIALLLMIALTALSAGDHAIAEAEAPTFDCNAADGTVEKLICVDTKLSALDRRLADVYAIALERWPDGEVATLRAGQRGWIKGRNDCWKSEDVEACVTFAYQSRIAELEIGSGQLEAATPTSYRCEGIEDTAVSVAYYAVTEPPAAVVTVGDDQAITFLARAASGARYTAPGVEAWEHQGELALEWFGSRYRCELIPATPVYEQKRPSRDGIGKVYMGREISQVMGHLGAAWLERPGREREERTDRLVRQLPLEPDDVVADIGAGTGYFSFPMAERVPAGRVLAVDIQQEMLDIIEARKADGAAANVETVLGTETDPRLPAGQVDLVLIVDAYHEFSYPREMGEGIARALRPGGRLVLIEYRAEDPRVQIKRLHKMSEAQAIAEMEAIGLEWERTGSFLPQQHFLVFRKPE